MSPRRDDALSLGPALLQRILPIRSPFLMIDRVERYARAPVPTLGASRHVTTNEPVFAGHFTFAPIVPGTLVLEGLSQAAGILAALVLLQRAWESEGRDPDEPLAMLRNLELGFRFEPGYKRGYGDDLLARLSGSAPPHFGMLAASEMRFRKSAFPGERLDYSIRLTREFESLWQFEVEATSRGQLVADGTVTNAMVQPVLPR